MTMSAAAANRLVLRGSIRVDLSSCEVLRRLSVPNCRKWYAMNMWPKIAAQSEHLRRGVSDARKRGTKSGNAPAGCAIARPVKSMGTKGAEGNALHSTMTLPEGAKLQRFGVK